MSTPQRSLRGELRGDVAGDRSGGCVDFETLPAEAQGVGLKIDAGIAVEFYANVLLKFGVAGVAVEDGFVSADIPGETFLSGLRGPGAAGDVAKLDVIEVMVLVEIAPEQDAREEEHGKNQPGRMRAFRLAHG